MITAIPSKYDDLLETAIYVWCTTVRPNGEPHTTPIWFIRDGETIYFYTIPDSQKVKNLEANPNIALSFARDAEGEDFFVINGTAEIDDSLPYPHLNETYMAKYGEETYMVNTTPQKYSTIFSLAIRVTPSRIRGND